MQYMKLNDLQRQELLSSLTGMTTFLSETFSTLTAGQAATPGPAGSFSPVEQVWHLADLEREGFGLRIHRLQNEVDPHLPDFDGDAVAIERDYRSLSLEEGLKAFEAARRANVAALQSLPAEAWFRRGTQEAVGGVSLCDMPVFMQQHDQAHMAEIMAWKGPQTDNHVRK